MKHYRKFLVAAIGGLSNAVSLGLLPSPWDAVTVCVISGCTAAGVFGVANAPPPPAPEVIR